MPAVSPEFKDASSKVEGAGNIAPCYQCSACVAECLADMGPVLLQCATCYKCYERCPQGTHPIEVITALKNVAFEKGNAPAGIAELRVAVRAQGALIAFSEAVEKRRSKLGLGPAPAAPAGEISRILYIAGACTRPMDVADSVTQGGGAADRSAQAINQFAGKTTASTGSGR